MKAEYINPFHASLTNTFKTMLSCEAKRGELHLKDANSPSHPISGVIGLSGKAVGAVVINLSEAVAIKAASAMLMTELTEVCDDVLDAVGEIANMVAGAAKAELEEYELSVSLPNVIIGNPHEIHFPSNTKPICIPYDTEWGPMTLEVSLELVAEPVSA